MKDPFKQHGAFSWFELMTTDTDGAKEFYSNLFGWDTEKMPMGDMNYTMNGDRLIMFDSDNDLM
jgi:hypothetical protein